MSMPHPVAEILIFPELQHLPFAIAYDEEADQEQEYDDRQ